MIKLLSFFTLFFILQNSTSAQVFKDGQKKRLQSFDLELNESSFGIPENNMKFREILKYDRISKKNKVIGFVFGGLGLFSTVSAIRLISESNQDDPNQSTKEGVGAETLLFLGVAEIALSIPFFKKSNKNRYTRDRLIREF